jgi:hypothetical protein
MHNLLCFFNLVTYVKILVEALTPINEEKNYTDSSTLCTIYAISVVLICLSIVSFPSPEGDWNVPQPCEIWHSLKTDSDYGDGLCLLFSRNWAFKYKSS